MEMVAQARLFGDYLPQNISRAQEVYGQLALMGSPRGQMVSSEQISNLKILNHRIFAMFHTR